MQLGVHVCDSCTKMRTPSCWLYTSFDGGQWIGFASCDVMFIFVELSRSCRSVSNEQPIMQLLVSFSSKFVTQRNDNSRRPPSFWRQSTGTDRMNHNYDVRDYQSFEIVLDQCN